MAQQLLFRVETHFLHLIHERKVYLHFPKETVFSHAFVHHLLIPKSYANFENAFFRDQNRNQSMLT